MHATWFLLAIANMSPPNPDLASFLESGGWSSATLFAGRPFHLHYESLALNLLVLCDMPSWFASILVSLPVTVLLVLARLVFDFRISRFESSYVLAGIVFTVATAQWLIIGYSIHNWLERRRWGRLVNGTVGRYFVVLVGTILLFTAVAAPILNERSRQLGFRHAGISFFRK